MQTAGPKATTAVELKAQLEAERAGAPFLVYRDGDGDAAHRHARRRRAPLWIGRRAVGRRSAWRGTRRSPACTPQLEPGGGEWTLVDDGLSRNGSFVNGERVTGRRRLRDRDMLRFGAHASCSTARPADGAPRRAR